MIEFTTPDLCDDLNRHFDVINLPFTHYGQKEKFWGNAVTIRCFEDNSRVKEMVSTPGQGKVLVVDGGQSDRCALLGDNLAKTAIENGWEGIVISGRIRDVEIINQLPIGVKCLGVHPRKSEKRGLGEVNISIEIGFVKISPDAKIFADLNGVIVEEPFSR